MDLVGLYQHLDGANQALGRLDGLTTLLPDTKFLLYLYIRKEALLSSQIDGTQSSFSALKKEGIEAVVCGGWVPFLKELKNSHAMLKPATP